MTGTVTAEVDEGVLRGKTLEVKIGETGWESEVRIDGRLHEYVTAVDVHVEAGSVTTVDVEFADLVDMEHGSFWECVECGLNFDDYDYYCNHLDNDSCVEVC